MVVICTAAASGGCSPPPGLTQWELSSGEQVQHHLLEPWRTKGAGRNCVLGPVPAARPKCRTAGGFSRGSDRVLGQVPVQAELWSRSTTAPCRWTEKLQEQACSWAPEKDAFPTSRFAGGQLNVGVGQVVQCRLSCSRPMLGSQRTQQALHRALLSTSLPATDSASPHSQTHPAPAHQEDGQV